MSCTGKREGTEKICSKNEGISQMTRGEVMGFRLPTKGDAPLLVRGGGVE